MIPTYFIGLIDLSDCRISEITLFPATYRRLMPMPDLRVRCPTPVLDEITRFGNCSTRDTWCRIQGPVCSFVNAHDNQLLRSLNSLILHTEYRCPAGVNVSWISFFFDTYNIQTTDICELRRKWRDS